MFGLDNKSGINVMPPIAPADSQTPLWFTEGGAGLSATYPGQDWFNQIQAELLNVLKVADIAPQKGSLTQLSSAISKLASAYAVSVVHTTGQSLTSVMSQQSVTKLFALKQSQESLKSGNHTVVSDNEYAYIELINSSGERLSFESLPHNNESIGNIILRDDAGKTVSVIKIPRKINTVFATLADLTGLQPAGEYATKNELSAVEKKSVQAFRYSSVRTMKTAVNYWAPASEGEFVIGIRTALDGGGIWIITDVKVATLQTFIDGKWVNIQNA